MAVLRQNDRLARIIERPPTLAGGVQLELVPEDDRHVRLRVQHHGHGAELRAVFLSVPFPSGLRRLLANEGPVDAVIVDRIPRGFAEAAEELDISYLDRSGRGRLVAPGFVYVAAPIPGLSGLRLRAKSSPFAPKASRVVRALLSQPGESWRLSALTSLVDINPGNAHRILASLVEEGLVERDEEDYVVYDPGSLLEAWAEAYSLPRERVVLPVQDTLDEEIRRLAEGSEDVVVSGEFAAEHLAPHLPSESAVLHCLTIDAWQQLSGGRDPGFLTPPVARRGQIVLAQADPGVAQFGHRDNGVAFVAPVQAYVDLYRQRDRGREAAEHLRREVLAF